MARIIEKPTLVIPRRDPATETVIPKVTCKVHFNREELEEMKNGKRYRLKCELWGADSGLNGDNDKLFVYSPRTFPKENPNGKNDVEVTFQEKLSVDVLDEDDGTDDIFAKVHLLDLSIQDNNNRVVDHKATNEVDRDF